MKTTEKKTESLVMDLVAISGRRRERAKIKDFLRWKYFCFNYVRCWKRASEKFPFSSSLLRQSLCVFCQTEKAGESIEHECTNLFIATQHRQKLNREDTIKTPRVQLFDAVTCARQMFRLVRIYMRNNWFVPIMTTIIMIISLHKTGWMFVLQ